MGWRVRAIDVLPDAISRARMLEARYPGIAGRVDWVIADLCKGLSDLGGLDLVTMFFFLDRGTLRAAAEALAPGGLIALETFTPLHRERFGKPLASDLTLGLGEAAALLPGLNIRHLDADWRPSGRHTVRASWRMP